MTRVNYCLSHFRGDIQKKKHTERTREEGRERERRKKTDNDVMELLIREVGNEMFLATERHLKSEGEGDGEMDFETNE